jgi:hypothetical protein
VISIWQEVYLGDSELSSVVVSPSISPCPSLGESVQEEAARAALKERPASKVPTQEKTVKVSDQQRLVLSGGGTFPIRDGPTHVEVAVVDALSCADGICMNEAEPRPEDASGGNASVPRSSRDPSSCLPEDAAPGDVIPVLRSSDIVESGAIELGLPSYPRALPPPASWRSVEGGAELTCSQVVAVGRLL